MLALYIFALSITCTVFVHAPPPMKEMRGYSAGGRGYSADVDIPLVGAFSTPMKEKRGSLLKKSRFPHQVDLHTYVRKYRHLLAEMKARHDQ